MWKNICFYISYFANKTYIFVQHFKTTVMDNLGMGVMINMLSGNEESVNAYKNSIGKKITRVYLDEADSLNLIFEDNSKLKVFDDGQSCCESRYMRTDDDLSYYEGSIFNGAEIKDAPSVEDQYGDHEVQFLDITTDKGVFTMSSHNEHNGYYGGFYLKFKLEL